MWTPFTNARACLMIKYVIRGKEPSENWVMNCRSENLILSPSSLLKQACPLDYPSSNISLRIPRSKLNKYQTQSGSSMGPNFISQSVWVACRKVERHFVEFNWCPRDIDFALNHPAAGLCNTTVILLQCNYPHIPAMKCHEKYASEAVYSVVFHLHG